MNRNKKYSKSSDINYDQILQELGFDPSEFEVLDLQKDSRLGN